MAVVQMRVSETLLRDILRLHDLDVEITDAHVDPGNGVVTLILDAPHLPDDVVEIEPWYNRNPGPDPIHLSGISYRYTDGAWARPEPIGARP